MAWLDAELRRGAVRVSKGEKRPARTAVLDRLRALDWLNTPHDSSYHPENDSIFTPVAHNQSSAFERVCSIQREIRPPFFRQRMLRQKVGLQNGIHAKRGRVRHTTRGIPNHETTHDLLFLFSPSPSPGRLPRVSPFLRALMATRAAWNYRQSCCEEKRKGTHLLKGLSYSSIVFCRAFCAGRS